MADRDLYPTIRDHNMSIEICRLERRLRESEQLNRQLAAAAEALYALLMRQPSGSSVSTDDPYLKIRLLELRQALRPGPLIDLAPETRRPRLLN